MQVTIGDNLYLPFDKPATIPDSPRQNWDPTDEHLIDERIAFIPLHNSKDKYHADYQQNNNDGCDLKSPH